MALPFWNSFSRIATEHEYADKFFCTCYATEMKACIENNVSAIRYGYKHVHTAMCYEISLCHYRTCLTAGENRSPLVGIRARSYVLHLTVTHIYTCVCVRQNLQLIEAVYRFNKSKWFNRYLGVDPSLVHFTTKREVVRLGFNVTT